MKFTYLRLSTITLTMLLFTSNALAFALPSECRCTCESTDVHGNTEVHWTTVDDGVNNEADCESQSGGDCFIDDGELTADLYCTWAVAKPEPKERADSSTVLF